MKFLLPLLFLASGAIAQSSSEEAIILNQELQFLENSARDISLAPTVAEEITEEKTPEEISLERAYFNDEERDVIRTKAAAPRRVRSF